MATDDERRFSALYIDSRGRITSQLYALTGDISEATDIAQEAFVRAWIHWREIEHFDKPEAWVRKVAYGIAVSRWRIVRRSLHLAVGFESREYDNHSAESELVEALGRISSRQRRALALHYIGGLSINEISNEMKAPIGTVKSLLSRGRQQLAKELDVAVSSVSQEVRK